MNNRTSGGFLPVSINYLLICFLPLFFFWSDGGLAFSRHLVAMHLWWLDFFPPEAGLTWAPILDVWSPAPSSLPGFLWFPLEVCCVVLCLVTVVSNSLLPHAL